MKYLVTGSSGFIGTNLIANMLEKDHEVYGISRSTGDSVTSAQSIQKAIRDSKPDCVVHLASQGNNPLHDKDGEIAKTNLLGTQYTIEAAVIHKVPKFIHISTSSVYRGDSTYREWDTIAAMNHENMYSLTKRMAEDLVIFYKDKISTVILRPFTIYGFNEAKNRLTPTLLDSIYNEKPFTLSADATHDWTSVDDFTEAIIQVSKTTNEGVYNFGTGKATTNKKVVKLFEKYLGKKAIYKEVATTHFRDFDRKVWKANTDRMKSIGLKTPTTLEEGIKKLCKLYVNSIKNN